MTRRFFRLLAGAWFCLWCGAFLTAAPAGAAAASEGDPKIRFASTVCDFGRVSVGKIVHADFVFTNTGGRTLEIKEVRPDGGATIVEHWARRIAAGESGVISLKLDTADCDGPVARVVRVSCNDPGQPLIKLQIKGDVWKAVAVAPDFVVFEIAPDAGSNQVRTVKIVSHLEQPLELSSPQVSTPCFRAEIVNVRPGREFDLRITPVMPLPAGNVQGFITIKTSSTNLPVVKITALAIVPPLVSATPSQLCLPAGALTAPAQYTVVIQNNSTQAMGVVGVSVSHAKLRHQVIETQTNRVFHVILTFPSGFQLAGDQPVFLNVKTTLKDLPLLKVPIFQPLPKNPQLSPAVKQ